MTSRLIFASCAAVVLLGPAQARAQFTDARSYDNTPVGINQLESGYTFVHGNAAIDPSLVIADATLTLNQGFVAYTRYFDLFGRVAWVDAAVPIARIGGSVGGAVNVSASAVGAGDSSYGISALLIGGPSLNVAQFDDYQRTTTIGVSVSVTAPTGRYDGNKILNLGSDRWSFKPEIALSQPFGPEQKWQLDAYANVYFYTDNTSYHGREILRQEPLGGLEGHISYSLTDRLWISLDARYAFRGTTFVGGVDQNNAQQNVLVGSEMNVSINARHSLLFEYAKAAVHRNGPAVTGVSVKYDYLWWR